MSTETTAQIGFSMANRDPTTGEVTVCGPGEPGNTIVFESAITNRLRLEMPVEARAKQAETDDALDDAFEAAEEKTMGC